MIEILQIFYPKTLVSQPVDYSLPMPLYFNDSFREKDKSLDAVRTPDSCVGGSIEYLNKGGGDGRMVIDINININWR